MLTDPSLLGISGKNRLLLTALHRNFVGPFTAKEAAEALGLSAPECHRLLSYLSGRGWLTRIRRGLYGLVSLDTTHPHEWVGDPWVLAAKLYGPSYYIGGWSACEYWDLTEQLFRETVVVTSRRARRRDSLGSWNSSPCQVHKRRENLWLQFRLARPDQGQCFRPISHGRRPPLRSSAGGWDQARCRCPGDLLSQRSLG